MSSDPKEPQPDPPAQPRVLKFSPFAALGARRRRRVPVILQLTPTDCGAACLAMTLEHLGAKADRLPAGAGVLP